MPTPFMNKLQALAVFSFFAAVMPIHSAAQLVREDMAPSGKKADPAEQTQNSSGSKSPAGKRRVAQEVQLTGEETWVDTGIDVHAGEHVVVEHRSIVVLRRT